MIYLMKCSIFDLDKNGFISQRYDETFALKDLTESTLDAMCRELFECGVYNKSQIKFVFNSIIYIRDKMLDNSNKCFSYCDSHAEVSLQKVTLI